MNMGTWARALAILLLGAHSCSQAHTKSETHSLWQISDRNVQVTFTVPLMEAQRMQSDQLLPYVREHLAVTSASRNCPAQSARELASTAQFRRIELSFLCPAGEQIILHCSAFFELVPSHVNFAQLHIGDGRYVEQLFTRDRQDVAASGGAELRGAGFIDYVWLGVLHILTGPDHMSFLLGLVLISRRLRDLIFVITGFTIGHSVTLALAVTGIVRPHAQYIDALVALTIAMIGAENIAVASQRSATVAAGVGLTLVAMAMLSVAGLGTLPPLLLLGAALFCSNYLMLSGHLRDAARLRLVATLIFGLIHGFGFAATLLEMQLPKLKLSQILIGFNIGVEIGQLALVLGLAATVAALARTRFSLPRPLMVDTVAAGLVAVGTYWFISRSYS